MGGRVARASYLPSFTHVSNSRRSVFCIIGHNSPFFHSSRKDFSLRALHLPGSLDSQFGSTFLFFSRTRRRFTRLIRNLRACSPMADQEHPQLPPPVVELKSSLKVAGPKINFCPSCGGAIEQRIPIGEGKPRAICVACGSIHYQNPKMVVGCLVEHEDKVLLCRRSIEPSYGLWTLPAGYMELGESATEGAVRETLEEANAEVEVLAPFAQLDIPTIGQSYILFRSKLKTPYFSPGCESLECALFKLDEIPFQHIAFSSISVALKMYVEDVKAGVMKVHHGVIDKRPGTSPSDPQGYVVREHLCS